MGSGWVRPRALVLALVVGVATVVGAAGPAAAAPSATVAPSTGLRPGDTVTASGSGFAPDDVVTIAQCADGGGCAHPDGGVAPPTFAVATVAGDGTIGGSIRVAASIGGYGCRPTGCRVVISRLVGSEPTVVAEVPLTFVAPSPAVYVTPATGLLDRHPIQANAYGLDHGARYTLTQCGGTTVATCRTAADDDQGVPPTGQTVTAVADAYTAAKSRMRVFRELEVGEATYDCATVTCRVGVVDARGTLVASTPLGFAATGLYVWPQATLEVLPSASGLKDQQVLTLRVSGMNPWEGLGAGYALASIDLCFDAQPTGCLPGLAPDLQPIGRYYAIAIGPDGTGQGTFDLRRNFFWPPGELRDCAVEGCHLVVTQLVLQDSGNPETNRVPLVFAPEWAPWPNVDRFLTEGVEAIRGAPLAPAARSEMAAALTAHTLRGTAALVQAAGAGTPGDATVGEVTRLYRAFFGRRVETGGLGYWVGRLQAGDTVASIGRAFGGTAEFRAQYDGLGNAEVVTRAYANTVGRAPDPGGAAYWTDRLDRGLARSSLILHFARSAEFRAREANRVAVTRVTWGLLGRAPGPVELTLNPGTVVAGILAVLAP